MPKKKSTQEIGYVIVCGPVIIKDGKTLLDKSGGDDFWKFCGGKSNGKESHMQTAKRKAKEELGIDVSLCNKRIYDMFADKKGASNIRLMLVHFLSNKINGEIKLGNGVKEYKWFTPEEIISLEGKKELGENIVPVLNYFDFFKNVKEVK